MSELHDLSKSELDEIFSFTRMRKYFPTLESFDIISDCGTPCTRWTYSTGSIEFKKRRWNDITVPPEKSTDIYYKETPIDERFQNAKKLLSKTFFKSFAENLYRCDSLEEIGSRIKKYKEESKEFEEGLESFFTDVLLPIANEKAAAER